MTVSIKASRVFNGRSGRNGVAKSVLPRAETVADEFDLPTALACPPDCCARLPVKSGERAKHPDAFGDLLQPQLVRAGAQVGKCHVGVVRMGLCHRGRIVDQNAAVVLGIIEFQHGGDARKGTFAIDARPLRGIADAGIIRAGRIPCCRQSLCHRAPAGMCRHMWRQNLHAVGSGLTGNGLAGGGGCDGLCRHWRGSSGQNRCHKHPPHDRMPIFTSRHPQAIKPPPGRLGQQEKDCGRKSAKVDGLTARCPPRITRHPEQVLICAGFIHDALEGRAVPGGATHKHL